MDGLHIFFIFYILGGIYGAFKTGQWFITGTHPHDVEWGIATGFGMVICMLCGAIVWPMIITSDWVYHYLQIEEKIK